MTDLYDWILVLHIAAWTSWMAGLFYLPRLFVYHAESAAPGTPASETFKVMERKLLRLIMTPAMLVAWASGLYLAVAGGWFSSGWMHAKLLLVVAMSAFHGFCVRWMKTFAADANEKVGSLLPDRQRSSDGDLLDHRRVGDPKAVLILGLMDASRRRRPRHPQAYRPGLGLVVGRGGRAAGGEGRTQRDLVGKRG